MLVFNLMERRCGDMTPLAIDNLKLSGCAVE